MAGEEAEREERRRLAWLPDAAMPVALANIAVAAATLAAVVLLTRLLTAEGYGLYASVLGLVTIVQNAGFLAIQSSVLRFHARATDAGAKRRLATAVRIGFLAATLAAALVWALAVRWLGAAGVTPGLALAGLALLVLRGWLNVVQAWNRATGRNWAFFALEALQSFGALALAVLALALRPGEPAAVIWGAAAATAFACACAPALLLTPFRHRGAGALLRELAAYGAPLALVALAVAALAVSDRLIVAVHSGPAAAGTYAVAFAIADRTMNLLLQPVPTATKPALFEAWERGGAEAARPLLERSGRWLIAIGFPLAAVLAAAPEPVAELIAGGGLAMDAARVIPWLAAGSLLSCLLSLHFVLAFQLGRKTGRLLVAIAIPAALNIAANLVLVPRYGMIAAGWTTVGGYALAVALAVLIGRREMAIPVPLRTTAIAATGSALLFLAVRAIV